MKGIRKRTVGTSGANTAQTVSTPSGNPRRILQVLIAYSATPAYTGSDLTIKVNSGAGAAYDTVLEEGTTNKRYKAYVPTEPIYLNDDDVLDVIAPAGGGVITSSISIYSESIGY